MILLELFWVFFFLGVYNFGGGYAMVPLIISMVVDRYHWIALPHFINFLTVSQITPGPIAINLATFIGFSVGGGIVGATLATIAVVLPSFIIITLIVYLTKKSQDNPYVRGFFVGIRPVIVGLIATSCISVIDRSFLSLYAVLAFAICFYLAAIKRVHPILVIFGCGFVGMWLV